MTSCDAYQASRSLRQLCASPDYFGAIASLAEQLARDTSAPELLVALREATYRLGADVSFFASLVREDRNVDSFRFLVACDPIWSLQYEGKQCVSADAWLRYAISHTEAVLAKDLTAANEREQQTIDLAARYGFRSTFIVPAPGGDGSRGGVLVLGSRQVDFFNDQGKAALKIVARGLAMELQERFSELMQRELRTRCAITASELELLAHERQGRPTKIIASILGCSAGAVDQRFHRLIGKLGVSSRGDAARLAAAYGLI